jgi:hydroxyacylglutathione hydrolase
MHTAASTHPHCLDLASVTAGLRAGAVVVDGRPADVFDAGHIAGAVNIPPGGEDVGALAARLLSPHVPVIAVSAWRTQAPWMAERLEQAGFRWVLGGLGGEDADRAFGGAPRQRSGAVELDRLAEELATGAVLLVDVRDDCEWREGHVPGSLHLPLQSLREAAHLLPAVPIVTVCSGTRRAAAAASALRRLGLRNIWRVADGGVADLLARPLGLDLLGAA